MKFFNTSGPVREKDHYLLSPLERWDMENVLSLIHQKKYFVLHAPRQTGKTSCILALTDYLNKEGKYKALYINVEPAQAHRENIADAMQAIFGEMCNSEEFFWRTNFLEQNRELLFSKGKSELLSNSLTLLSNHSADKPLVVFIDEIDTLIGDTLVSVLRQLRARYTNRPDNFPQSIVLCGVRDVRDYRLESTTTGKEIISGGSAFNIKDESLRLGNFTKKDIITLYKQHTTETGQVFAEDIFNLVWHYTEGQPWLVNALAYDACFRNKENRDRTKIVTKEEIIRSKENLILRRDTHIDQLYKQLEDSRVKKVIQKILTGEDNAYQDIRLDDIQYSIDLGLIVKEGGLKIANAIYQEIIPRELSYTTQLLIAQESTWYINKQTNRLEIDKLLKEFQNFYRKSSQHWLQGISYIEAAPQLLLQAFLQRIINGGGRIEREYGLGRRRVDLYICWYDTRRDGLQSVSTCIVQEIVIEMKIIHTTLFETVRNGLTQALDYADKCGTNDIHLIVFDKRENKTWTEKVFVREMYVKGKKVKVWGV
jgi:hypothetical protein